MIRRSLESNLVDYKLLSLTKNFATLVTVQDSLEVCQIKCLDIFRYHPYNIRMYSRIQLIETALASIATVGPQFLDDVNDFPSVVILRPSIAGKSSERHQNISSRRATVARNSIGNSNTLDSFTFTIRGYTYSDIADSITVAEELARNIEMIVQNLSSPDFYSAKVIAVHTDEGLFAPYGICDIQCEVEWMNE